ncbi:hypothetical protein STSC103643_07205 [Staphylococcus schleiferi subsp. schleiferi]
MKNSYQAQRVIEEVIKKTKAQWFLGSVARLSL